MKHNKTIKSIIALILCAVIALSGIGTEKAYAASKKAPLKVGFKGKTITLIDDLNIYPDTSPKLKTVIEKWGKPKIEDEGYLYTWKKGKTKIEFRQYQINGDGIGGMLIEIKDKNGSLWGVKVGMKKGQVIKKLEKALGSDVVLVEGEITSIRGDFDVFINVQNEKNIYVWTGYGATVFELKNGKVTYMRFFRS